MTFKEIFEKIEGHRLTRNSFFGGLGSAGIIFVLGIVVESIRHQDKNIIKLEPKIYVNHVLQLPLPKESRPSINKPAPVPSDTIRLGVVHEKKTQKKEANTIVLHPTSRLNLKKSFVLQSTIETISPRNEKPEQKNGNEETIIPADSILKRL
jgi:hypothetical protein